MKAIVCEKLGPPSMLRYKECPKPNPSKNEVIVKVNACSLNFPDTLIIQGKYQFKPPIPFTPGSDIAGEIDALGNGVKHLKVGDQVFGLIPYGGLAQYVAVPSNSVYPKPPDMSDEVAASFLMAFGTSYHALKDRAELKKDEILVVMGASGGVGSAAIVLGKLMGARVIACASSKEKLTFCRKQGADEVINYTKEDLKTRINELTGGKGANVIFDPVGGHFSESAVRTMGWGGRYLVIGFAAGNIPKIALNIPLLKSCAIVGVFWGSWATKFPNENFANTMELMQWYTKGKIKPHIHKIYSLDKSAKALEEMMARKVKGKLVVTCS